VEIGTTVEKILLSSLLHSKENRHDAQVGRVNNTASDTHAAVLVGASETESFLDAPAQLSPAYKACAQILFARLRQLLSLCSPSPQGC
jgi:hypothetical protein